MSGVQLVHTSDRDAGEVILCSNVPDSAAALRCRFGALDVTCQSTSCDSAVCKVPTDLLSSGNDVERKMLLSLLDEKNVALAETTFIRMSHQPSGMELSKGDILPADPNQPKKRLVSEDMGGMSLLASLSFFDRYLPVWIIAAMVLGVVLGYYTNAADHLSVVQIDTVSLPIAIGLWLMMWPVLCKVKYEVLGELLKDKVLWYNMMLSLFLNWVVGPALMTGLAWALLPDLPGYRNGIIIVGIARCIAMVLIWNQLAGGNPEHCAVMVAINSVMQIVLFAPLSMFYLRIVSQQYNGSDPNQVVLHLEFWAVMQSVLIFLGAPLVAGVVTRYGLIYLTSVEWYEKNFASRIGPLALLALIYTIIIMFTLQGHRVITEIGDVCRVCVPMLVYFSIMWTGTMWFARHRKMKYEQAVTQAFTAASNNFELAIAISVSTFGIGSQEALAATVGPLVEVPALLALVYVAIWIRRRLQWE